MGGSLIRVVVFLTVMMHSACSFLLTQARGSRILVRNLSSYRGAIPSQQRPPRQSSSSVLDSDLLLPVRRSREGDISGEREDTRERGRGRPPFAGREGRTDDFKRDNKPPFDRERRAHSFGDRDGRPSFDRERRGRGEDRSERRSPFAGRDRERYTDRNREGERRPFEDRRRSFDRSPRHARGGFGARSFRDDEVKPEPAYGHYEGDHLYGVNVVRIALQTRRRRVQELLVQEDMDLENKKDAHAATEILKLAEELEIPVRRFSKHDLNMISDNRPHQGFILRAEPLQFTEIETLEPSDEYKVVLALDEVSDPQNFGALLRSAYFLGVDKVVVCAKNSSPLSAAASKASAGAMELVTVHNAKIMMRFLDNAKANGWQVVGTAVSEDALSLPSLPLDKPTVLVLGNEGHGVRTNILKRCDHLVKIDSHVQGSLVDSLNVSVCGGILLHQLTRGFSPK